MTDHSRPSHRNPLTGLSADTSRTGFDLFVWSLLECHLSIIFACAPSLRVFLRRYIGENWTARNESANRNDQNEKRIHDAFHAPSVTRKDSVVNIEQSTIEAAFYDEKEYASACTKSRRISDSKSSIKNAAEYEAYAMRQLRQHACKPSEVSDDFWRDLEAPVLRHDAENAVGLAMPHLLDCMLI